MDRVAALEEDRLLLGGGERLPCDVLVPAYGLKYQAEPPCLKGLGIGAEPSLLYPISQTVRVLPSM